MDAALASVTDDEIGEALELLWGSAAVNTWNSRRAGVLSWLGWCRERGYEGPMVAKSGHKKPENVRRYFKPSPAAISELTSLLAPGDARH
jgi:hypothetical protein